MIVISGTITIDPAKRDVAIAAMRDLMAETRKEKGCVTYVMSGDFEDAGCIRLFEEWESQAAIDAHTQAPHMKKFGSQVAQLGFRGMKLERYEVSSKAPLGGKR
jgi:quinol monooxygenase YgiN